MTLTTILIIIAVIVVVVLGAFLLVPYLKKKGILNQGNVDATKQVLNIAETLLNTLHIGNADRNHQVFTVCEKVVQYIEQTMKYDEPEAKKIEAEKAVLDALDALHIHVNDKIKALIEIGIESAVNLLPKTNA